MEYERLLRRREAKKRWRDKNPEKARECVKNWNKRHPGYCTEHSRKWRKTHPGFEKLWRYNNSEKLKKSRQEWDRNHPGERNAYWRRYRKEHPEILSKISKKSYRKNIEKKKKYSKEYRKKYPEKERVWAKKRRKDNPWVRIGDSISSSIRQALKGNKAGRHWETLVGWTNEQGRRYLENLFTPEMTWENYGTYWEIHHKIPQSLWDISIDREMKQCWTLCNLEPLGISENRARGNRTI